MSKEIIFITGNKHKLEEIQMMMSSCEGYKIVNQPIDLDELQEIDLKSIALHKLEQAKSLLPKGSRVFVEDTALVFNEFNGLPGAYIKWFVKSMGLKKVIKMLDSFEDKSAQAITTVAYSDENGKEYIFQGITDGKIVDIRGPTDFGWDAIFEPTQEQEKPQTYAEMDKIFKNKVSHRGKAFDKFKEHLNKD